MVCTPLGVTQFGTSLGFFWMDVATGKELMVSHIYIYTYITLEFCIICRCNSHHCIHELSTTLSILNSRWLCWWAHFAAPLHSFLHTLLDHGRSLVLADLKVSPGFPVSKHSCFCVGVHRLTSRFYREATMICPLDDHTLVARPQVPVWTASAASLLRLAPAQMACGSKRWAMMYWRRWYKTSY